MRTKRAGRAIAASWIVAAGIAGLVAMTAISRVESREACYRARVAERVELPGGSIHPSGQLRICEERRLSPVSRLYTIAVGDGPAEPFLGREAELESAAEAGGAPLLVFRRIDASTLRFEGFLEVRAQRARLYRPWTPGAKEVVRKAADGPSGSAETVTVIAVGE